MTVFNPQVKKCELQLRLSGNTKIQTCNIDKKQFLDKKLIVSDNSEGFMPKTRLCLMKYNIKLKEVLKTLIYT